ncbi:MAG: hypothetical protein JNG89_20650 [Planctomycetaceae bacterium]|nr:hypothetical protein [Planctomycetaceae bacterium]
MTTTSRRHMLRGAAATLLGFGVAASAQAQDQLPGQLTEAQLGEMITALGIKPEKQEQRFDFAFKAKMGEEEWELSMSSVLSQDGKTIWVMAWLDPLPESATAVPRNALLRLLAENDHIGNGKFFAYIPSNRRFVMQKTVANENMTSAKFKVVLQDLGTSVVETHPIWAVKNWSENPAGTAANAAAPAPKGPAGAAAQQPAARAADNARPNQPVRR